MSNIDASPVSDLIKRTVIDPSGDKVGTVSDVYLDNDSGQPEWLAVSTGMFGSKVSFVPLADASITGDDLTVAHSKDTIKDAPRTDPDGELSPQQESALYAHYGRGAGFSGTTGTTGTSGTTEPTNIGRTQGRDTSGPMTDSAMTRSEEEIDVGKRTQETGKARLRKWIDTEHVQMTVPVRRESARVVTEPITDANRDAAYRGADLTTEEHEITLNEEVVDVNKNVVPKERVRLETDVQTEDVVVDESVRKERIEVEDDTNPRR